MQHKQAPLFANDSATYVRTLLRKSNTVFVGGHAICKADVTLGDAVQVQVEGYGGVMFAADAREGSDGELYISDEQEQYIYN
jgi:hypothetical protein